MASSKGSKPEVTPVDKKKSNKPLQEAPPPPQWVIVQLSSHGEKEKDLEIIKKSVSRILKSNVEVFIPAISQKVREEALTTFYMEGYIFIKYDPSINYSKLNETTYFRGVLRHSTSERRKFHLLKDSDLNPMRLGMKELKISEFSMGEEVKVIKGQWKNLIGKIVLIHNDEEENIQLSINLRSKPILIEFPSSYLEKIK